MSSTVVPVNIPVALKVQLGDNNASKFANVTIYDADSIAIASFGLTNLTNGLYGGSYTFTSSGYYLVIYKIWNDAGFSIFGGYADTAEDYLAQDIVIAVNPDHLCQAADVKEIAPEFVDTDVGVINRFIDMVSAQINHTRWGAKATYGCMYLTAHLMSLAGLGKNSPYNSPTGMPLTQAQVGQVMFQNGQFYLDRLKDAGMSGSLALTKYGLEYSRLLRTCLLGVVVP